MLLTRRQTLNAALASGMVAALPRRALSLGVFPFDATLIVRPVEHASLILKLDTHNIAVDPVGAPDRYLAEGPLSGILVTHEHPDHFDADTLTALVGDKVPLIVNPSIHDKLPQALQARTTVMANGDTAEIAGMPVKAVPAYNTTADRLQYHPKGRDNGYVLTAPYGNTYIAGDTEDTPEFRAQENVLVALVPMNLPYTMTADQAAAGVAAMAPRQVVPYHHRGIDPAEFEAKLKATGSQTQTVMLDWYPETDDATGKAKD